jgi:hypothetical protein
LAQLYHRNFCPKVFILPHDLLTRIMISKGALAEYSQVEMLLRVLPRDLRAKAVMKLELHPSDPWTFKYDTLPKYFLDTSATGDALDLLDVEGACRAPGVSIHAGYPFPQMPVVANLAGITKEETLAAARGMGESPIAKAENQIDRKMNNMMKAVEAGTFQLSEATKPRYGGYQTARANAIQADHAPPYTPMNFPTLNAPMGPAYY